MVGSLIFALIVAPVAASLLMRQPMSEQSSSDAGVLIGFIARGYRPLLQSIIQLRWIGVAIAGVGLAIGVAVGPRLGSEFVPRFNEGDLLIRATMAPSISLDQAKQSMTLFERQLLERFPEVTQVVTRVGRGEVGAHADPEIGRATWR